MSVLPANSPLPIRSLLRHPVGFEIESAGFVTDNFALTVPLNLHHRRRTVTQRSLLQVDIEGAEIKVMKEWIKRYRTELARALRSVRACVFEGYFITATS